MRVALGLGMLLRECKCVIEYEADETAPNISSYISTSVLDNKCLNLILDALNVAKGGVVRMSKARVDMNLKRAIVRHGAVPEELDQNALYGGQEGELEEKLKKMAVLKEQMQKLKKSKKKLEDSNKMLEKESADLQEMYYIAEG
ncbi:hypothetical protein BDR06DRAFT_1012085 [Suillus hirtellus]|nr:hypothetical protein BDR06DRAFT_1012085 [Suillus hirtellus]